jgi:hypothetical protein
MMADLQDERNPAAGSGLPQSKPEPTKPEPTIQDTLEEQTKKDPTRIVTEAPAEHFRLGYVSVACLVINRIIGELSSRPRCCQNVADGSSPQARASLRAPR